MSRETDTSSSGPNGRGGAAYPSGTPPYGTPAVSDGGTGTGRSAPGKRPDQRKTETTLTTRIRINIPGSRPIPPVVVRTPVGDAAVQADEPDSESESTGTTTMPVVTDIPQAEPAAPAAGEKPASDWFAPRKPGAPKGGSGGPATNGAGLAAASSAAGPASPAAPGGPAPARPRRGTLPTRPVGPKGSGLPGATGGQPVAPGHGGGTGSYDVSAALASGPGPAGTAARPAAQDDLPYFADQGPAGGPLGGPAGPTGGPATGQGSLPAGPFGGPSQDFNTQNDDFNRPGGGLSDDTAVLTPQFPGGDPDGHGGPGGPRENVSGHTLTSGIPVVPPGDRRTSFGPGSDSAHTPPTLPEPERTQSAPAPKPAKKKGRSKLVLLTVALVLIGSGVYGAGLLMNRTDVPKGTTVLGVDIGGGTRDEAVNKLDEAVGDRTGKALRLTVDGETVTLKPDQAGLQFDAQATVRAAATSDYHPVSVIGSLFGRERPVEPVMPVDEEKLRAALQGAAGGSGSSADGTITFQSGKAVPVYGKEGKGIDVDRSLRAVEAAYHTQVETGTSAPVRLPTTTREPTVAKAEVDRMMKDFAQPAMSGIVTVKVDSGPQFIQFSPQNSLWKFLGVKADGKGKLVEYYDRKALQELYGTTFDGVLITRGNGKKTAVTPEDVIGVLRPALLGRTPAERTGVIETDPS